MSIPVVVRSAFSNSEHSLGTLLITPNEIQQSSGVFGSSYILRMGLHYQRYVVAGYLPNWTIVHGIYLSANPAPRMTTKNRSNSVTGNIGESVLGIVARRLLGAMNLLDVLPLNVTPVAKCPDFRVRITPTFPPIFQTATGLNPTVTFSYWPAESKAVESAGRASVTLNKALLQLGTYWYERLHVEPDVAGFGLVCCFIYKGIKAAPLQTIRLYVFCPSNQAGLRQRIDHFRKTNDRDGFLQELATSGSVTRGCIQNG